MFPSDTFVTSHLFTNEFYVKRSHIVKYGWNISGFLDLWRLFPPLKASVFWAKLSICFLQRFWLTVPPWTLPHTNLARALLSTILCVYKLITALSHSREAITIKHWSNLSGDYHENIWFSVVNSQTKTRERERAKETLSIMKQFMNETSTASYRLLPLSQRMRVWRDSKCRWSLQWCRYLFFSPVKLFDAVLARESP